MAITWTHNGSDNKWSVGDTATFTATGDLPDWIKNGEFDAKVYYVTSNGTTDAATATGDGVSYSNNTLTLTMSISMDINDWTVQVFGDNSSNVLRWSGFGAVSALWADPGCQADDAERGDLTHLIVRTYEQQQSDNSWSSVTAIDPSAAGTYRTTYNVTDGYLDATPVTRVLTLPQPAGFYLPITPGEDPPIGTRPPVLNRVEMTGEGGYSPMSYMYQNIDTVYMIKESSDLLKVPSETGWMAGTGEDSLWKDKQTMIPDDRFGDDLSITREDGETVKFATVPNCIRVATGYKNSCVMFRDGVVTTGSGTLYGGSVPTSTNQYSWLADNWANIVDMFMPTSYQDGELPNLAIMRDGSLVGLDLADPTIMSNPPTILTNMRRIRAVNQGHAGDMICETDDGTLYYVYGYGYDASVTNPQWKAEKITTFGDVNGDDIYLMSLGDYGAACRVVLHGDPRKTRQIYTSRTLNGSPAAPDMLSADNDTTTVNFDEDLLDITANELGFTYATASKMVYTSYHDTVTTYETDTSTLGEYVRTIGSTAYAVIHKRSTGYYVGVDPYFGGGEFVHAANMTALEKYIIDSQ